MTNSKSSIFRSQALDRYFGNKDRSVYPKLVSPRIFLLLWVFLGLIAAGGLLALIAEIPINVPALAVVIAPNGGNESDEAGTLVAILFSPRNLSEVRAGQRVFINCNQERSPLISRILDVEAGVISPKAAEDQFALGQSTASKLNESKAVAFSQWERASDGALSASYVGSSYDARIEIGSRRAISLIPVIGRFFRTLKAER